jgi:serine protease AprX
MAPDSRLVNVKVADAHGAADVTQVIAALDWVYQHAHDNGLNIRVVNLSYGTDTVQPYALDPLAYAAETLWRSGIVVVSAAGNYGVGLASLDDPAYDPYLLAVGAADTHGSPSYRDDTAASFSNWGNLVRDPDILAPGVHIQSLRVPGSYIDTRYASTGAINSRFFRGSGSSQATAVVSGAAALLLQKFPTLTPDALKHLVTSTADPINLTLGLTQSADEIDLGRAMASTPSAYRQLYVGSTGLGLVEASRGTHHLVMNGVALTGEQDIFGSAIATGALAGAEATGTSWSGGSWLDDAWTGTSWSGTSWSGTSWSTDGWTGTSWSGTSWSATSWSDNEWTGTSWSGTSWSTNDWSGTSWSTGGWACASWS